MKKNPFSVDNGASSVDERNATESPTSREETSGTRARNSWTHRGPRNVRNSARRSRGHRGAVSSSPECLETPPRSPGAPPGNSDADANDQRDEVLLRSPGEYGSNPDLLVREIAQLHLDEIEEQTLIELNQLTERTGMPLTQENGQRRYGPPLDCDLKVPPRGSEVFVGKLPRNCYEPELVPVFEKVGKIYELRLMMDFSGTNRGYCFVHYFEPEEADRAVQELNNYEIRRGRKIGVVKSVDNCRLFVGGLPKDKNAEEIRKEMDKLTDGVVDVHVYTNPTKEVNNRGYAFIEYNCHKAAAMARRKLMPGKLKMWGLDIAVDWAEPKENDTNESKDVSVRENKCDQNGRANQHLKAGPSRDRNQRFKNGHGHHSRPAFQNSGQSVAAEQYGYERPGIPIQQTPNVMLSIQQQAVFNQGYFPNYGAPQPTISPQYQPVSCAQFNSPPNSVLYGISPPMNPSIPIPITPAGFRRTAIPGVPDEVYLGQWYNNDLAKQQPLYSKFPVMPNQWVGLGMNQHQGMNC